MRNTQNGVETSQQHPTTPCDIFEIITEKNHALRAFSALIKTARLSDFDSSEAPKGSPWAQEAENLQWGLSKLIDLYLDDQEQALESFANEYLEGDIWLIKSASTMAQMFREGAWIDPPMDRFRTALEGLETVIARSTTFKPLAETIKADILKYVTPQTARSRDQGGVQ